MSEVLYGNMENTYKRKGMYVTGRLHPKIKSHYLLTPPPFFFILVRKTFLEPLSKTELKHFFQVPIYFSYLRE